MIEGPLAGKAPDSAIAADVTALTGAVASNTSALATKADSADLIAAEGTITTHSGEIAALTGSLGNLGTSFYTKVLRTLNYQRKNLSLQMDL